MTTKTQKCGRCKRNHPLTAFSPSRRGKPGKWCRAAFKTYRAEKATKKVKSAAA